MRWIAASRTWPWLLAAFTAVSLVPAVAEAWGWRLFGVTALVVSLCLLGAGVALWRRETRTEATVLVLAGDAAALSSLDSPPFWNTVGYWGELGFCLRWAAVPFVAFVLLNHPGGRLRLRRHRWLVVASAAWAIGFQVAFAMVWDPAYIGYSGPDSWFAIHPSLTVANGLRLAEVMAALPLAGWFVTEMVLRWRHARGVTTGTVRWVAAAGVALGAGLALRQVLDEATIRGWSSGSLHEVVDLAHQLLLAAAVLVLLGLGVRAALRRGVVTERLLHAGGDPVAVEQILREELKDPRLRLRFVVDGRSLDATGVEANPEEADDVRTIRRVLVRDDADPVVDVTLGAEALDDPGLLGAALSAAAVALDNGRLTVERAAHLAEISASRTRIVEAGLAQRRQLERDLHDGAQQHLLAASATLTRAQHSDGPLAVASAIADARGQLTTAMAELRRLARGVHPAALSQHGLAGGLASLSALAGDVDVQLSGPVADGGRLGSAVESTAYFVVAEAVTNARRYAPGSTVRVRVRQDDTTLTAEVEDDGAGGAGFVGGGGLSGLQDRVHALGGSLDVDSGPAGTTVRAILPLAVGAAP